LAEALADPIKSGTGKFLAEFWIWQISAELQLRCKPQGLFTAKSNETNLGLSSLE